MQRIWTRELVRDMTKPEVPRARMRLTRLHFSRRADGRSRRMAFFPVRNRSTHTAEQPWERTVARAAPFTPMWKMKMNTGAKIRLMAAPRATVIMPMRPKPWELMKGFIPRPIITKRVPQR